MATFTITRISGTSGAAGSDVTFHQLSANSADNTTVTPAVVMTTTAVPAGTWKFSYYVNAQTAATTTGISFRVAFAGTTTLFRVRRSYISTGSAQATGIMDGIGNNLTGQLFEGQTHTTNNTDLGPNTGVDVVDASVLNVIEGFAITTTSGDLTLAIRSETAATAVRITGGSHLILEKIA